jgi:hypothetical protein
MLSIFFAGAAGCSAPVAGLLPSGPGDRDSGLPDGGNVKSDSGSDAGGASGLDAGADAGIDGGDVLPCRYAISSASVDFLAVDVGHAVELIFTVSNVGSTDCVVTDLELASASDPAFSLPDGPIASQQLSAPGTAGPFPSSLQVAIDFLPPQPGNFSGEVDFNVNDQYATSQAIRLSGSGGNYCLILVPPTFMPLYASLDPNPYCQIFGPHYILQNPCADPVDIAWFEFADGGPFSVSSPPPAVLYQSDVFGFTIDFNPTDAGTYVGQLRLKTNLYSPSGDGIWTWDLTGTASSSSCN